MPQRRRLLTAGGRLALLVLCALLAAPARAWRWGSGGRVRWDFDCQFAGAASPVVASQSRVASALCGDLCLLSPDCSHWGWTPPAVGADDALDASEGSCVLRGGAADAVALRGAGTCGFIPGRFEVDEAAAFDLGVGPLAAASADAMGDREAEKLLRTLNFLRLGRGAGRLQLDARLLLAARDVAASCPAWTNMDVSSAPVPGLGRARALAMVTASDATADQVLESWASGSEDQPALRAIFAPNASAVGLAKRSDTYCRTLEVSQADNGRRSSSTTTIWTLLLS